MRVMTYNIRGGLGMDGHRDTARIAEVAAARSPDIICFQEIHQRLPWSGWIDQPRRLRHALHRPFVFQANVHYGFGRYGVGVATRFPVLHVCRHRLPSQGESRGALEVALKTPDGPLMVFCTHWGLTLEERKRQAQALSKHVRAAIGPVLLCGDLNDRPETDYIQAMLGETGLCDWGADSHLPTYPADAPDARIDVIFASTGLVRERLDVIVTQASDHLPVVADLRWSHQDNGF
jgi:endonuclease/exonuclease/phosphatase family metal-dependent hydrolase